MFEAEHYLGSDITGKWNTFIQNYTHEYDVTIGFTDSSVEILKPSIYKAVNKVNKYYKKALKKEEVSREVATFNMGHILDCANVMCFDDNSKSFEEALKSADEPEEIIALFNQVTLKKVISNEKINFRKTLFAAVLLFQLNAIAAFGQTVVKGSVKDNTGKPISGVVVTDGAHFNTTDAEGNYVLNTDPTRYPMVYISTPATYELPSKEGIADGFYQYLDAGKSENQCDFVLTKRQKPVDEFVYIVLSDPQVRNEKQLDRFRTETVPDLKQTADSLKNFEIVGMGLGIWCGMP